jgi:hypothetical protein
VAFWQENKPCDGALVCLHSGAPPSLTAGVIRLAEECAAGVATAVPAVAPASGIAAKDAIAVMPAKAVKKRLRDPTPKSPSRCFRLDSDLVGGTQPSRRMPSIPQARRFY